MEPAKVNMAMDIVRIGSSTGLSASSRARWRTIYDVPVRIDMDKDKGHRRFINLTMACIVLQNMLHCMRDDEAWLGDIDAHEEADNLEITEQANRTDAKRAGIRRREELRDLINSQALR